MPRLCLNWTRCWKVTESFPDQVRTRRQRCVFRSHNPNHENHDQPHPPKLQVFAPLLDAQPPEVQEAFRFLLATAMHEAGKFGLLIHIAFNLDIASRLM